MEYDMTFWSFRDLLYFLDIARKAKDVRSANKLLEEAKRSLDTGRISKLEYEILVRDAKSWVPET